MRTVMLIVVAVCAAAAAADRAASSGPLPTVSCESAVLQRRSAAPGDRVVLGRVSITSARVLQLAKQRDPEFPYWRKLGLYVRAGEKPITIAVPRAWRGRVAVNWGDSGLRRTVVRLPGCPSPPSVWNGYVGGFDLRAPACVPLIFRTGDRTTTVRFGLGRACK
jgi:hypothetical protein